MLKLLMLMFIACSQDNAHVSVVQTDNLQTKTDTGRIEHYRVPYFVDDINNDQKGDSVYVIYDRRIRADSSIEKECVSKSCEVTLKFTGNIPDLVISPSLSINVQKADDLNGDKTNEIILFSEWVEGWWGYIYVWTYKNGTWEELARTKAFLSEDEDWEGRVIKENDEYYLLGDGWDNDTGVTERSIRVKIE
ncbi:MAG TPA: hypothetical protein DIW47_13430 [Bacteroidetes bacterium]|nr:hypothetical protein [Bacteroidota bacterium]